MDNLFLEWCRLRRKFIIPLIIFLIIFYSFLPVSLALWPDLVTQPTLIWGLPFIWLYAFLQILMTWFVGWLYWLRTKRLDEIVKEMRQTK